MTMSKTDACTFCRTRTFRTTRPSSAFMGRFCLARPTRFLAVTENMHTLPPVVILRLRNMTALDATGLFAIEEVAKELHASKRTLILCGAREQPAQLIHQAEFAEVIGEENIAITCRRLCGGPRKCMRGWKLRWSGSNDRLTCHIFRWPRFARRTDGASVPTLACWRDHPLFSRVQGSLSFDDH